MVPYFVAISKEERLIVDPLSDVDVGEYKVVLRVFERNAPNYFSDYLLEIEVTAGGIASIHTDQTSKIPYPGQLTAVLREVSLTGLLKIEFSKLVEVPYFSKDALKAFIFLDLKLSTPLEYTWFVKELAETHLTIKIDFANPNSIGLSAVKDVVTVSLNPLLFKAKHPVDPRLPEYLFNSQFQARIHLIVDPEDPGIQAITQLASVLKFALGIGLTGAFLA